MNNLDHEFSYNVKAVVQETGLRPDTLRAWERRYGLPNPQRTGGGHRLNLARNIIAALTLGDLNFLDPAAIWVEEMLGHYRLSSDLMPRYLQIYHQVAKKQLDERGQLLVDYLAQLLLEKGQS